tara:strand:+ start:6543 stop:7481 length:939 start_codon:yes stop_codon:yes gene_type:complete
MNKGNLILFAGVTVMAVVIIVSNQFFKAPGTEPVPELEVMTSADGRANIAVSNYSGVTLQNLTPWQVVSADVLAGTFLVGYDISDPRGVIDGSVAMEIKFPNQVSYPPTFFKTVGGLTTLIDDVTYIVENGNISAAQFTISEASRIFALNHYGYRNSRPVLTLVKPSRKILAIGESAESTIVFGINEQLAVYGQDKDKERAHVVNRNKISAKVEYFTDTTDSAIETVPVSIPEGGNNFAVELRPKATVCAEVGIVPLDAKVSVTYEANLYERNINDWLRVPVSDVEWQVVEGATQNHTQSFMIRQPFECVAQ